MGVPHGDDIARDHVLDGTPCADHPSSCGSVIGPAKEPVSSWHLTHFGPWQ